MDRKSIKEGTILWEPPNDRIKAANITRYMKWLKKDKGLDFSDYDKLWKWSVTQIEAFWE